MVVITLFMVVIRQLKVVLIELRMEQPRSETETVGWITTVYCHKGAKARRFTKYCCKKHKVDIKFRWPLCLIG
jgi:hypothetical protein